jgi:hypothetical protein
LIVLNHESFWGLFDETLSNYQLACIDVACPTELIATSKTGDRYQIKLGKYAMQPDIISLADVSLPTTKL